MSYGLVDYGAMVGDRVRMTAYEEALRRVVTPSSVVLDIGAGTGVMALIAARLGARRVIAVEPNPLVRIGARLAVENGLADRITFVHGRSQEIEPAELADVVVCDLRGGLPTVAIHVAAIVDARRRLMKPGAVLLPVRDTLMAAPVEAAKVFADLVKPWREGPLGLGMSGAESAALNEGVVRLPEIDRMLGPGVELATLEYAEVESAGFHRKLELPVEREGVMHGLAVWFDTVLVEGVGFSTAPNLEKTVYGRLFLPLPEPAEVAAGDVVRASVRAVVEDDEYLWIWSGRVRGEDGSERAAFTSSSAFFNPENPAVLEVAHEGCVPALSGDGRLVGQVLQGMDGACSVAELADRLLDGHPGRFEYREDALAFVQSVVRRYGETMLRLDG